MKKRGFTLIELLGVLIVLSIIALILVPTINKSLRDFKEESYQNQLKEMCLSVENWKSDHISELPEEGETITISLGNLKNGGYIDYEIKNPLTDRYFPNDMLIELTKVEKSIHCKVIENSGNNKEDYNIDAPILILKGNANVSLDVGERYVELGYYATTSTGITIPKESIRVEYYQNGNKVSGIDSSKNGTFEIKYSVTDKEITVSLMRKVGVKDITPPVMVINRHSSLNEEEFTIRHNAEETFAMPTVTVTDNSKETITPVIQGSVSDKVPGNYTLTYTATDSTGNSTVMKVHYVVYDETAPTVEILGNPTTWTNQSITLAVNAKDNGSGLPSKAYSFDGGSTWQSGNTLLVENNQVLNIWVKDNAGNVTKNIVTVSKIDKSLPDVTFTVTSGTSGLNYWYTSNINVKITPTTGGSGVSSYKYCTTNESSCSPSTLVSGGSSTTVTFSSESATNKICVVVTNTLGSTNQKCSENYKIDKSAPTLTVDGHTSDYSVSLAPTSSYTIPNGSATDNLTTPTVSVSGSVTPNVEGTYKVTYVAKDEAGNSKSLVLTVNVMTLTYTFNYTGGIQTFTVPASGIYKLEVWGAQGGSAIDPDGSSGTSKGGYAYGNILLTSGQALYICVGGVGVNASPGEGESAYPISGGGYNGGGSGWGKASDSGHRQAAGGGGGATHIATTNRGVLSNYASYQSEVLIVAGGSAGARAARYDTDEFSILTSGGAGGTGGGNAFGQGADARTGDDWANSGGGGGWSGGSQNNGGTNYIQSGMTNTSSQSNIRSGHGYASITFVASE